MTNGALAFGIPDPEKVSIRVVMMPCDTNSQGTIFGGHILSLIDQAGYVQATREAHHRYVTVAFQGVEFKKPVFVGDVLSLYTEVTKVGRTSISIHVRVFADRLLSSETAVEVTEADVVFVAVDENSKPIPIKGEQ